MPPPPKKATKINCQKLVNCWLLFCVSMVTMTQGYIHTIICEALEREKKICPWKSSGYTTGVHPFLSQKHSLLYTECCDLDHSPRVLCYRVSPFPFLQLQYLQAWMLPCTTTTTTCVSSQTLRVQYPTQHILEYWIVGNPLPLPEKQHSVLLLCTFKKHT